MTMLAIFVGVVLYILTMAVVAYDHFQSEKKPNDTHH